MRLEKVFLFSLTSINLCIHKRSGGMHIYILNIYQLLANMQIFSLWFVRQIKLWG